MTLESFKNNFKSRGRTALKVGAGVLGAGVVGLGLMGAVGGKTNEVQNPKPQSQALQPKSIDQLLNEYNSTYGTSLGQPKPRVNHTPVGLGNIAGIESPTRITHIGNTSITKTPSGATIID